MTLASYSSNSESQLHQLVTKWLTPYRTHPNFASWFHRRLYQENYQQDKLRLIQPLLKPHLQILDLGCGMGGLITALRLQKLVVTSLDFNFDYCRITRLRGFRHHLQLYPLNSLAEHLPLKTRSFDLVLCFDVLEHVQNPHLVLSEVSRVLKPQGQAIITVINRFGFYDQHFHLPLVNWLPRSLGQSLASLLSSKHTSPFPDRQMLADMHYFTYSQFTHLANQIGFQITDLHQQKLLHPQIVLNPKIRAFIQLLHSSGLTPPLYWLYTRLYANTFLFLLTKP